MIYNKAIPFHIAIDFIIFGFDNGELKLLATRTNQQKEHEEWSLLSGFLEQDENLKLAAARILNQLTGLATLNLEQLYTYHNPNYDQQAHVISVAYYAIIKLADQLKELPDKFNHKWFKINEIQGLISDPEHLVDKTLQDLQEHAKAIPVGITLMPDTFTLNQLQDMYEAIFQKKLDRRNFRKNILSVDLLEKTEEKDKSGSRKGAWLFRFNEKKFFDLIDNGVLIKISL
jgi:8-oxo-dGTP diphosphatase